MKLRMMTSVASKELPFSRFLDIDSVFYPLFKFNSCGLQSTGQRPSPIRRSIRPEDEYHSLIRHIPTLHPSFCSREPMTVFDAPSRVIAVPS